MSKVNRSTYQKLAEENKRLLKDLYIIAMVKPEAIQTLEKWRDKFKKENEFNTLMREVAIQYIKDHPEYDIRKRIE